MKPGTSVRYHGSIVGSHGAYTVVGACPCGERVTFTDQPDAIYYCGEVGGHQLVNTDGDRLLHVRPGSFTAT